MRPKSPVRRTRRHQPAFRDGMARAYLQTATDALSKAHGWAARHEQAKIETALTEADKAMASVQRRVGVRT